MIDRMAALLSERRRAVTVALAVITAVLATGVLRLDFETSQDTLVNRDSTVAEENRRYQAQFGGDAMLVAWTGDLATLTSGDTLQQLREIEEDLRATDRFDAVIGPVTALEFAENQLEVVPGLLLGAGKADVLAVEAGRLGAAGEHSFDNPAFVEFLLYEADGSIRPALRDNFPDENHLVMLVRLHGNADIATEGKAADDVQRIASSHPLTGFRMVAGGTPTLLAEINDYLQGGMATLGLFAVLAMLVLLLLLFRARWRLLSLGVVAVGCVWAFGLAGHLGIPLTLVTISGLPILLGLGVDFAVQFHSRFEEELRRGNGPAPALHAAFRNMAAPLLVAMGAAVVGVLALELSRVPMLRDFGILLAIGVFALVLAALAIVPLVVLAREHVWPTQRHPHGVRRHPLEHVVLRLVTLLRRGTVAVAAIAVVLACVGVAIEGGGKIQTDPEKWVDQDGTAVHRLEGLREATGFSSEVDVLVEADDVTAPEVVAWMQDYADRQLAAHDELLRVTSLPAITAKVLGVEAKAGDVEALTEVAPRDIRRSFVAEDGQAASLVFPVAPISLEHRERLLDAMVADLDPPAGVRATPAGLAVIGVELVDSLEANRQAITLLSLGLVFVWLLLSYRRLILAVAPLVPVLLAVGLSTLVIRLLGIELTPLTTVASPLAIAIATEFSVLVMARYLEERRRGLAPEAAIEWGGARIGRAFLASGLTLLGGFAVLVLAPMPLLVDFGVVVSVIVLVALLSCLIVMPAILVRTDPVRTSDREGAAP
jgi:hydrophobe/amphiphile efflux-3 (HAE3) family protein